MAKTTKKIASVDSITKSDYIVMSYRTDDLEDEIKRVEGNAKADFDYQQNRVTRLVDDFIELKVRLNKLERILSLSKAFLLYGVGSVIFFCAMIGLRALITN